MEEGEESLEGGRGRVRPEDEAREVRFVAVRRDVVERVPLWASRIGATRRERVSGARADERLGIRGRTWREAL